MTENYDNVENDGPMVPPGAHGPHQVTNVTDQQLTSEANMVAAQSIDQTIPRQPGRPGLTHSVLAKY